MKIVQSWSEPIETSKENGEKGEAQPEAHVTTARRQKASQVIDEGLHPLLDDHGAVVEEEVEVLLPLRILVSILFKVLDQLFSFKNLTCFTKNLSDVKLSSLFPR